jgi:hypothetical protein
MIKINAFFIGHNTHGSMKNQMNIDKVNISN